MEKIATSTSSFEKLRKGGYVYVDKTDILWRLVSETEDSQFFMSRPRRFGKSLMLSTLKCIFEGRRELFKGLKIDTKRYDWKKYPVVMLDMSMVTGETLEELKASLNAMVDGIAATFDLKVDARPPAGTRFGLALDALFAKRGEYVVLVDEYDVPLQGFLSNHAALRRVRTLMHDFYVQLKAHSGQTRFLMLTGVTKDELILPNHLVNLGLHGRYKNLLYDFLSQVERQLFEKRMIAAMRRALGVGDTESLVRLSARLKGSSKQTDIRLVIAEIVQYFNKLPFGFSLATEDSARRQFQFFMEMLGARVTAEEGSARGYADAIVETKRFVWVFEFKFNKSANAAIRQIREKGYADAYRGDRRPVTLVGVNFRLSKRNIDEPIFSDFT